MPTWDRPNLESEEIRVLDELKTRDRETARMFSAGGDGSQPSGSMRWNNNQNVFQRWVDNAWSNRQLAVSGGGTSASSASGARTNLDVYSKAEVDSEINDLDSKIDSLEAEDIDYDNTESGLTATSVQDAIDEVVSDLENTGLSADNVSYDNSSSGFTSSDVQGALDESYQFPIDIAEGASGAPRIQLDAMGEKSVSPEQWAESSAGGFMDVAFAGVVRGDDILYETQESSSGEIVIALIRSPVAGQFRIQWRSDRIGSGSVPQLRVRVNGSQVYNVSFPDNLGTITSSGLNVQPGDEIELRILRASESGRLRWFRIQSNEAWFAWPMELYDDRSINV